MSSSEDEDEIDLNIFCPGDDGAGPARPAPEVPSWRLPPEESHSDFAIAVTVEPDDDAPPPAPVTEYHVHKERLCVGPRRSAVLAAVISSGTTVEAAQNRYSIVLKPSAAEAFPILLDYLYTGKLHFLGCDDNVYEWGADRDRGVDEAATVSFKNCVALRFLSSYLGMTMLHQEVNEYARSHDFLPLPSAYGRPGKEAIKALAIAWEEGGLYHDDKMLSILKRKAVELLKRSNALADVRVLGKFLSLSPFEIIQHVWESPLLTSILNEERERARLGRPEPLERVDTLAEALLQRRFTVDGEVIALVTSLSALPTLTHSAAMKLLEMISDQSEWTKGSDNEFDNKMKNLERRCVGAAAEDWETALDSRIHWTDLNDESRRKQKRQKLESSCKRLSAEVESNLLRSVVAKASEHLALKRKESSKRLEQYIDLGQSVQDYEWAMSSPKHSLFVFGNSGASGGYRLYDDRLQGLEKKYVKQSRYRYDEPGHTDDRGHCYLQYNQTKSCWQIRVEYWEKDEDGQRQNNEKIKKLLLEVPRQNDNAGVPKLGWKDALTGEDRPDILALEFETLRQAHNPAYSYDADDGIYERSWRP